MTSQVLVEIEGPSLANLYRIFEERNSDLLLKIYGRRTVSEATETTDKSTANSTEKVVLTLESWQEVNISQVLDWETGKVNVDGLERDSTEGNLDAKPCLGFLRLRINGSEQEALSLSFHDQLIVRGLREEDGESQDLQQFVFILASREEGPMKGVRYRMSGQSVTAGAPEGEVVEIVTPCMEKIRYKMANTRKGSIINSLMEDVQSDGVKEVLVSMEESISPKFHQEASSLSKEILSLEEACRAMSERIESAKRKLDEKLENSVELKKIRGIQSDLDTALEWVINDVNMNIRGDLQEEEEAELAILEDHPLDSSMTTNVDNESPDLLPSSQNSF